MNFVNKLGRAMVLMALTSFAVAQVPALKVTAPNGKTNVLIGSFHAPVDGMSQPTDAALKGFERYVVEGLGERTTFTSRLRTAEAGTGPGKYASWTQMLRPEQRLELRQRIRCLPNMPNEQFASHFYDYAMTRTSSAQAAELAIYRCASAGTRSRDQILAAAAKLHQLPTVPLETADQVEKQRERIDEHIYQHILRTAFTPQSKAGYDRAVRALSSGQYEKINTVVDALAANHADATVWNKFMVVDRNYAWMVRLVPALDQGGSFVNVGAAHLPGPGGLLALLRARGYRIERISLPARSD